MQRCSTSNIARRVGAILVLALCLAPLPASAAKFVALVVGVSHYSAPLSALPSPVKDSDAMASTLQGFGFQVFRLNDPDVATFQRGLVEFVNQAKGADAAVVFYSGHGFQLNGENYFVPVDGSFDSVNAFKADFTTVSSVIEKLDSAKAKFKFIILDACRSDPFVAGDKMNMGAVIATAGLAEQRKLGVNTLISYASAPGEVSLDLGKSVGYSFYTHEFLKVLRAAQSVEVGVLTRQVRAAVIAYASRAHVEQVPWEASSMSREFYFSRAAAGKIADILPELPQEAPKSGFIIADSGRRALTLAELAKFNPAELRIARNEIFARHGRIFVSDDLRAYFAKFSWYHPVSAEVTLSQLEEANVVLIREAEKTNTKAEVTVARAPSDFLIPDSDAHRLTRADLVNLSPSDLRIARNEIYARRGRYFQSADLKARFEKFSWYQPYTWNPGLNPIERANVDLIQSMENGPAKTSY
ncbi:MAG: YARHG domain-containing protein [Proteobacteria bacterium]|nr:YARHG domain-containing protein [Pseudomonadota bacterium]